ncbi:MAG: cation transporter [Ruminococcaceae bacterium]|nr:cation transporter [Oscillospiraceae bacterium]
MTDFILRLFVKDYENKSNPAVRAKCGGAVAIIGIIVNLFLAAFKLFAGILSGSISITADAVNNISDAGSQVVSLITFKISAKPADRDHPFGYARIEYVASMIVSFLILFVSISLFSESIQKILNPSKTEYSILVMIILAVSVLGKLWLFFFGRSAGKKLNSDVIRASATDSLSDAGATFAVLVSAIIAHFSGFDVDGYMGVAVAIIIFIAGIKVLNETKNSILGSAPEPEVVEGIHNIVKEYDQILGIHDMVVHNYGPGNTICSFHAEVDGKVDVFATHDCIDNVERRLYNDLGIRATIHMDPIVTDDEKVTVLRVSVAAAVKRIDERLTIHDFRYVEGITHSNLIFDVTVPFEIKESNERIKELISNQVAEMDPNYFAVITVDRE